MGRRTCGWGRAPSHECLVVPFSSRHPRSCLAVSSLSCRLAPRSNAARCGTNGIAPGLVASQVRHCLAAVSRRTPRDSDPSSIAQWRRTRPLGMGCCPHRSIGTLPAGSAVSVRRMLHAACFSFPVSLASSAASSHASPSEGAPKRHQQGRTAGHRMLSSPRFATTQFVAFGSSLLWCLAFRRHPPSRATPGRRWLTRTRACFLCVPCVSHRPL